MIMNEKLTMIGLIFISKIIIKFIAIDSRKQQLPDVDPKAIQQINYTGNLDCVGDAKMFFILKRVKETIRVSHKKL